MAYWEAVIERQRATDPKWQRRPASDPLVTQ
ncbi:MAG: hypothetical protein ACI9OD_004087 [Limisphaerales bacterium]|jgi:hypothetical protein